MEQWRDVPGYIGLYQVSDLGNVRTCAKKTTYTKHHGLRHWKQRIIKPKISKSLRSRSDARVDLWKDGKPKTWLVARLVGLTWCDGYADGMTINHINGNSLDNRADNLEWVSLSDNIKLGFTSGLYDSIRKKVRLTDVEGAWIEFDSMAEASRYLGRNRGYISGIVKKGKNFAHSVYGEFFFLS